VRGAHRRADVGRYEGQFGGYEVSVSNRHGRWQVSVMERELLCPVYSAGVESPADGARVAREWIDSQVSADDTPISGRR
jgi:hypothetical protein